MTTPSAPGHHPQNPDSEAPDAARGLRLPGVEEPLPPGETVVWRGRPGLWPTAFRVLHLRALLFYWALVAIGFLAWGATGGPSVGSLAADLTWLIVVALLGTGVILLLAWLIRVTSLYVVTEKRVVMRVGIALPGVLNLPHEQIGSVDLRRNRDGSGDLVLTPVGEERIGWLFLWPHVRPWHWKDPIPALRALSDVQEVGDLVASVVRERTGQLESSARSESPPARGSGPRVQEAVS